MDLIDKLRELANRIQQQSEQIETEEATKTDIFNYSEELKATIAQYDS